MIEKKEIHDVQLQDTLNRSPHGTTSHARYGAAGKTPAAATNSHTTMLGAVREMLGLAIEGAFDLRLGREQSPNLRRLEEMLENQMGILDSLENGVFTTDPGLLTRRAQEALHGFAAAVRHEIIEDVRPGMNPTVFDAALQRMTDRAVMAGAAFASLALALEQL
jgi:hypothetical protein